MTEHRESRIVVNSDLIIRDPADLATLCVFYDKVLLPYTTPQSSYFFAGPAIQQNAVYIQLINRLVVPELLRKYGVEHPRVTTVSPKQPADSPDIFGFDSPQPPPFFTEGRGQDFFEHWVNDINRWAWTNQALFGAGALERLPPPATGGLDSNGLTMTGPHEAVALISTMPAHYDVRAWYQMKFDDPPLNDLINISKINSDPNTPHYVHPQLVKVDLVLHLLRTDVQDPALFVPGRPRPSREALKVVEATSAFRYLLPRLNALQPEEILEIRALVSDTREGFSMHLQSLSAGIDERLADDATLQQIQQWADHIVETSLIPDFREFQRQLGSRTPNTRRRVLDVAGKVLEIDSGPATPKFWGKIVEVFGMVFGGQAGANRGLPTNRSQAFQFMGFLEDVGRMRAP